MPVNEILAPFFVKVFYHTSINQPHVFRLYLDEVPVLVPGIGYRFAGYIDALHPAGWTLLELVDEVTTRSGFGGSPMPPIVVDTVEAWRTVVGVNIFMGFDTASYAGVTGGTSGVVASAYWMWVMKAGNRDQFRLTFMDAGDSKPQRTAVGTPPAIDDGGLNWFIVNGGIGFVTNDNLPLVDIASVNTGYNRKLARNYGRTIIP